MKICVGLSGGVDSSVAALLLKQQGYDVFAMFMQNWHDADATLHGDCEWEEDRFVAELVARKIGIPFYFVDLSKEYRQRVVDYMFNEYSAGRTPNPDVLCNREIKFDAFLKAARKLGADMVFNPMEVDPVEFVKSVTEGRGADVVFNTTAIPSVVPQAIAMTGKAGRMIQYSSMHPDAPTPVSPQMLHGTETVLTGSISPDGHDFFVANRLLSSGIIDCKSMIARTFPFAQAQDAFEAAIVPGTFRVIITD